MADRTNYLDAEWEPQRARPSSPWPVDRSHLARYTLGDAALEREVLTLFLAEAPQRIDALRKAVSDKDWKMAAHTLKGSGRAVGAWQVANLAQDAEGLCGSSDPAQRDRAVDRLEAAMCEAAAYIARIYGAATCTPAA